MPRPIYYGVPCPKCRQDALADDQGRCVWCDTVLLVNPGELVQQLQDQVKDLRRRRDNERTEVLRLRKRRDQLLAEVKALKKPKQRRENERLAKTAST